MSFFYDLLLFIRRPLYPKKLLVLLDFSLDSELFIISAFNLAACDLILSDIEVNPGTNKVTGIVTT